MSQASAQAEAARFDNQNLKNTQKMAELAQSLGKANANDYNDEDEAEDQFGDEFEQSLMQEAQSMGMFDKNKNQKEAADVYTKALQKVETEVSKSREKESSLIDTTGKSSQEEFKSKPKQEEDDLDDYADQRMDEMFNEEN